MKSTPGVSESLLSRAQLFEILRRFRARVFLQLDDDAAQSFERAVARQFQVEVHFRVALFVVVVFVDEEAFGIVLDIGIKIYLMTTRDDEILHNTRLEKDDDDEEEEDEAAPRSPAKEWRTGRRCFPPKRRRLPRPGHPPRERTTRLP